MRSFDANGDSRLHLWLRVREFAVPPSMIESATVRRAVGDWAGACAAARVDVDLDLRSVGRVYGREFAARVRADLRCLAPDLLRWHFPRIAPDGLLRPSLTLSLARYRPAGADDGGAVHLVARTPPAWADGGQRIGLALWDASRPGDGVRGHPHPRPDRRFRLDLHRHLWDVRRVGELWERCGAALWAAADGDRDRDGSVVDQSPAGVGLVGSGWNVGRWEAEARLLLRSQGRDEGAVAVRLGARRRLVLDVSARGETRELLAPVGVAVAPANGRVTDWPVLPDAATWVLPDLELLRAGLIDADRLHPLVASALVPGERRIGVFGVLPSPGNVRLVMCRGGSHRIGLVSGELVPLDHDLAEIRREELLVALGGTPLPCLQAIDAAHRSPECLADVRGRLDHGDVTGALAAVEALIGPDASLRSGALRDELEAAVRRRINYGLFRSELVGLGPVPPARHRPRRGVRTHPRHATFC